MYISVKGRWSLTALSYLSILSKQLEIAQRTLATVYNQKQVEEYETDKRAIESFQKALNLLKESRTIIFIGFGYLEENFNLIEFEKVDAMKTHIIGSGIGVNDDEGKSLNEKYGIQVYSRKGLEYFFNELNLSKLLKEK